MHKYTTAITTEVSVMMQPSCFKKNIAS